MSNSRHAIVKEQSIVSRFALVVIVMLAVSMITLILIQRLKPSDSSTQDGSIDFEHNLEEFTPGQAITASVGNITVYVPEDSTNLKGNISIIPREPNMFASAGEAEWNRPQIVNVEFQTSEGATHVTFSNPIQICFSMTEEQWPDFLRQPDRFQVQYYAEEKNPPVWEPLPVTNYPDRLQLCGQTYHLSIFALAIKSEAIFPITGPIATSTLTSTEPSFSSVKIPELNQNSGAHDNDSDETPNNLSPTNPPPTDPPPTDLAPTGPAPTDPSVTDLPADPAPTDPPITDLPPTDQALP